MEDNMKILESMGFTGRELNRKVLTRAKNDIREAVTLLTSSHLCNDDFMTSNEHRPTSTFGSLTEKQMKRQQNITSDKTSSASSDGLSIENSNSFTTSAFLDLEKKVYGNTWSILYKRKF
ncbi:unnamed protein product, partial [Rotaria sordida]